MSDRRRPVPLGTGDRGISSIVGEILMVAVAIAVVAGAWLFFSGFTSETGPEEIPQDAVRAIPHDPDDDGDTDWIRLSLVKAGQGAFDQDDVQVHLLRHSDGASYSASASTAILCTEASAATGSSPLAAVCASDSTNFLHASSSQTTWEAGQALFVPCQAASDHEVTVTLRSTVVLDVTRTCGEAAA